MSDKQLKIIRIGFCIIATLVTAMIVFSVVGSSAYSIMAGDDFSVWAESGVGVNDWSSRFWNIFSYSVNKYKVWQGAYLGNFLEAFFCPVGFSSGRIILRILMVFNSLFFFGSLIYLIWVLLNATVSKHNELFSCVIAITLFVLFGYDFYEEIFCWYTASVEYLFSIDVAMLGVAFFIQMHDSSRHRLFFLLAIACGIVSMGGIVMICGLGCSSLLVIMIWYLITRGKIYRYEITVFFVWVACALANALAPGNFNRHGAIDESGIYPIHALFDAVYVTDTRWQLLFSQSDIVFWMLVLIMMGIIVGRRLENNRFPISLKKVGIGFIANIIPVISAYPVTLGYTSQLIPNRCEFVVDLSIVLIAVYSSLNVGIFLSDACNSYNMMVSLIGVMSLAVFMLDGYGLSDIKFVEISKQIKNGIYSDYYKDCYEFYDMLDSYPDGYDVIVSSDDVPEPIDNMYLLYLLDNSNGWVNRSMAKRYNLSSITLITAPVQDDEIENQ